MTINAMLLSEYTLETHLFRVTLMNRRNEYITQTTKDTKIPPNVGETPIKHGSSFRIVLQRVQYNI